MTFSRTRSLTAALILLLLNVLTVDSAEAAKKKHVAKKSAASKPAAARSTRSRRAAAPPPVLDAATGGNFQERLVSLVNGSVSRSSDASIQIVEVDSGQVVAERNAQMPLAPASNMKLFTTAAAIDLLKPTFQLTTTVYVRGTVDATGTLNGDVKVVGHGDPTIGGRFHDGRATAVLEEWATDIKRAGIKTIKGNLIFEYGYMDTDYIHPTWPRDQLVNWYEAPVSAFSMNENCVAVRVTPNRGGGQCNVQLDPPTPFLQLENSCRSTGGRPFVTRQIGTNKIIVRGGVPARSGTSEIFVTVQDPIHYFASATRETFERSGIHTQGELVVAPRDARTDWKAVSQHTTPLNIVVYVVNKKSQNHYAEELVKILGAEKKQEGSWAKGTSVVTEWLTGKLGVPAGEYSQADGSGMSRNNRASSRAFINLLRYMWKSPYREDFVSSLPYTGDPDSKFGHRLRTAPFARQVYAKTGYIVGVVGLSGYVHAKSGKVYAFSFIFNRYHVGVFAVYHLQDEMLKEIILHG
jgi:D-alanyl-D-alanine carboxypeptidase/D-alanyl-D-alanine-endopeptidase (penicillin-binding protein 4)